MGLCLFMNAPEAYLASASWSQHSSTVLQKEAMPGWSLQESLMCGRSFCVTTCFWKKFQKRGWWICPWSETECIFPRFWCIFTFLRLCSVCSCSKEAKQLLNGCWLVPPSKCRQNKAQIWENCNIFNLSTAKAARDVKGNGNAYTEMHRSLQKNNNTKVLS